MFGEKASLRCGGISTLSLTDRFTSECVGFRREWDPGARECSFCKKRFPEEYSLCEFVSKRAQELKEHSGVQMRDFDPTSQTGFVFELLLEGSYTKENIEKMVIERLGKMAYVPNIIQRFKANGLSVKEDAVTGVKFFAPI